MIKQVNKAMKTVINDQVLPKETLSRPITPVSDDPNDYDALKPNHIVIGLASPNSPPGREEA